MNSPNAHAERSRTAASLILAAGKGSRMIGYDGNKTLLPLRPTAHNPYEGSRPMLVEVLENLPLGPKGIVVHHRAEDVRRATSSLGCTYIFQPVTDGTGGALLAARPFLKNLEEKAVIITMGDVPLIRPLTYFRLLEGLRTAHMNVLAFHPEDSAQYGKLEVHEKRVQRIVEWQYWRTMEGRMQQAPCNAGVYAVDRTVLLEGIEALAQRPHEVRKKRNGRWVVIQEYFLTDLTEIFNAKGLTVTFLLAEPWEVMGVDTPEALAEVQKIYRLRQGNN
ncbi:NTP transferase domain-containing protein [Desulfosoma caldarium]|uniref:MobA-like NTP transferase protein n=1 Tax=Desulfosoma caldarium TaxID=610254 RepID=A0A3N1US11_9BACT|nr:NTP transferase domain-containing protein [Desulfosoma caldarium]ROQ89876.1 MobA-like NTP transferase protein [Desulfosoma caldarium]